MKVKNAFQDPGLLMRWLEIHCVCRTFESPMINPPKKKKGFLRLNALIVAWNLVHAKMSSIKSKTKDLKGERSKVDMDLKMCFISLAFSLFARNLLR